MVYGLIRAMVIAILIILTLAALPGALVYLLASEIWGKDST